uniref:WAP domain-containing protein n=1 Tax=Cyprinus carpio TaxID=7962 RepID=A0A8C1S4M9_CYPCA
EMMTARVCCSLIAVLLCLFVYLSTTDAKEYVTEKPGVCPKIYPEDDMLEDCAELCSQDGQCPDDEKCCSNGCGQRCMPPYKAKPGMCPRNNVKEPVFGVCAELCSRDSDCPNDQKCCSNGCGHQCMPPYKGIYIILMCGSIYFLMQ